MPVFLAGVPPGALSPVLLRFGLVVVGMGRTEARAGGRTGIAVPVIGAALTVVGALLAAAWPQVAQLAGLPYSWPSVSIGVGIVGIASLLLALDRFVWAARCLLFVVLAACSLWVFDLSGTVLEVLPPSFVLWPTLLDEWPVARGDFWLFCGALVVLVSSSADAAVRRLAGWVALAVVGVATVFGLTFLFGSGAPFIVLAALVALLSVTGLMSLVALARSMDGPRRWFPIAVVALLALVASTIALAFLGGEYAIVAALAVVAALIAAGQARPVGSSHEQGSAIDAAKSELELLRGLAVRIPDLDYVYDVVSHKYIYSNRPMAAMLGVQADDVDRVLEENIAEQDRQEFHRHIDEILALEDERVLDFEFRLKGTQQRWFRHRASVFKRDEDGRPKLIFGTLQDVTERRRLIRQLKESEERFERIASRTPGAIFQFAIQADGSVSVPYISAGCESIFGVPAETVMATAPGALSLTHPNDRSNLMEAIERSRVELTDFSWTGRIVRDDGGVRWILANSRPMRHEDGSTVWDGVLIDVTDEKQAQLDLEAALDRLDFLLTESPTVIYECMTSAPYAIVSASANVRRLLGYTPDQLAGRKLFAEEHVHENDRELVAAHGRQFVDHGASTAEYRMRTVSGDFLWVRDEVRLVSQPNRFDVIGSWTDVTEQRRSMERTLESEARLQRLARRVEGMLFELVLDPESRPVFVYVGPGSVAVSGLSPEELQARPESFFRLIDIEDRARLYRDLVRTARDLTDVEWEGVLRDQLGRERSISVSARPFESRAGVIAWSGIVLDRTWQRSAEAAMDAAELRLAAITNSSSEAIVSVDESGRIVGMNPVAERLFGTLSHEAVHGDLAEFADADSASPLRLVREDVGSVRRMYARRADGRRMALDVTVTVTDQTVTGLMSEVDASEKAYALVEPVQEREEPATDDGALAVVIAPESRVAGGLEIALEGLECLVASTAGIGLELSKRRLPQAIVVFPGLPDSETVDVLQAILGDEDLSRIPVVVVDPARDQAARLARLGVTVVSEMSELAPAVSRAVFPTQRR